MSNFIREPWIYQLLNAQIYQNIMPTVSQRCQLIDVVGETDTLEIIVSDRAHSITAVLSRESIASFKKIYAQDWAEVKGCLMTIDGFYFDYSFEKNTFFIYADEFSYFGSEGETIGDPISVNHVKNIKEILCHEICGKLHISELDLLYGVIGREKGERRKALDILIGHPMDGGTEKTKEQISGGSTLGANACAKNAGENPVPLGQSSELGDIDTDGIEAKSKEECGNFAVLQRGKVDSQIPEYDSTCCRTENSVEDVMMCRCSQSDGVFSNNENKMCKSKEQYPMETRACAEDVQQTAGNLECKERAAAIFSEHDSASDIAMSGSTSSSREKGLIDFCERNSPTNFDLSIFTKKKRIRDTNNSSMYIANTEE